MPKLATFQIGTPRARSEGLRIGTVRFLPRGVRKEDYARRDYFDVWLPILSPSRGLLKSLKDHGGKLGGFFRRYEMEMRKTDPWQTILLLAELSQKTPLAIGCYCEDESNCHRSVLAQLIGEARE